MNVYPRDAFLCAKRLHVNGGVTNSQSFKPPDLIPFLSSMASGRYERVTSFPTVSHVTILGLLMERLSRYHHRN